MSVKVTVRMGGAGGATTVDYTSQVPVFTPDGDPNITAAQGFTNGQQFEFTVIDDIGEIPKADLTKNLPAHTVVHVTEDGPGYEAWLARGRIARKGWGREDHPWGDSRTARVTVDDQNTDLKGLVLTASWERPEETGRARVLAALAAFCNGSPRVTTVISNHLVAAGNEVTMPAKTYPAGTDLPDIFNDCGEMESKEYSVVIHHQSGASHLCFWYATQGDHTTFASAVAISDDPAEIDPDHATAPVFAPIWDQGDASVEEGQDKPVSHVVSKYGDGEDSFVVSSNSARVTNYDHWAVAHSDSESETAAQAATRAASLLAMNAMEHVTHQVTIWCKSSQVDLLSAGMSINIKSAASMGGQYLGTTQTRRIASLKWEPIAPEVAGIDGVYAAHMMLDRPLQLTRPSGGGSAGPVGPKPPTTGTPGTVTGYEHWTWDAGEEYVANTYAPDLPGPVQMLSQGTAIGPESGANGTPFCGLMGVSTTSGGRVACTAGTTYRFTGWYQLYGDSWPETSFGRVNGSWGVIWYDSAHAELRRDVIGEHGNVAQDSGFVGPDTADLVAPTGAVYFRMAQSISTTYSLEPLNNKLDEVTIQVVGAAGTSGTTPPTLGGPGEGSFGTPGTYLPADAVIEHGDLSDKGGTMHDATQVGVEDVGAYFTGTTVEAALQELGAGGGGVTDHGALTGLGDNDHPQYALDGHTHGAPTGYYRPLMDGLGNVITDSGTGAAIMAYAED